MFSYILNRSVNYYLVILFLSSHYSNYKSFPTGSYINHKVERICTCSRGHHIPVLCVCAMDLPKTSGCFASCLSIFVFKETRWPSG